MKTKLYSYLDPSPPSMAGGPLSNAVVVVQPNISVRGWPTEAGSLALENYTALEDATAVERLRDAGATIIGSSRMAELGLGLAGDNTREILAEDKCDLALVTDTMGEARISALNAGLAGFKPSYGIISRFGLIGLVPSMECYAIAARTTEKMMAVLEAISGEDDRDPSMRRGVGLDFTRVGASDSAVSVGIIREWIDSLGPGEMEPFNASISRLESGGGRIEEISLPDFDLFGPAHNVIGAVEASSSAGKYDSVRYGHRAAGAENWNEMYLKSRAESFGPTVKSYLFQGAYFQFENFTAFTNACRVRRRLCREIREIFEKVDLLAGPARRSGPDAAAAGTIEEIYEAFALTLPANVAGLPSICIPGPEVGSAADPGLQLVGPPLSDPRLLSFAGRVIDCN